MKHLARALALLGCFSSLAFAEESQIRSLKVAEFETLFSGFDEVKPNVWDNWGLTEREWQRYQNILDKTPWGHWEHTLSPLGILIIYSKDPGEKQRLAEIEARLDQWRQSVAFELQRVYNNQREVVHAKYAAFIKDRLPILENVKSDDRIALFANAGNCDVRCTSMAARLLKTSANLDIFVIGAKTDDDIFKWAAGAGIPIGRVKTGQITLNYENNIFSTVSDVPVAFADIPSAYVKRGGGFVRMSM